MKRWTRKQIVTRTLLGLAGLAALFATLSTGTGRTVDARGCPGACGSPFRCAEHSGTGRAEHWPRGALRRRILVLAGAARLEENSH